MFFKIEQPRQASSHGSKVSNKGSRVNADHRGGVLGLHPQVGGSKDPIVPSSISCEVFDLDMFISPLFKERTFSDECGIRRQGLTLSTKSQT